MEGGRIEQAYCYTVFYSTQHIESLHYDVQVQRKDGTRWAAINVGAEFQLKIQDRRKLLKSHYLMSCYLKITASWRA